MNVHKIHHHCEFCDCIILITMLFLQMYDEKECSDNTACSVFTPYFLWTAPVAAIARTELNQSQCAVVDT